MPRRRAKRSTPVAALWIAAALVLPDAAFAEEAIARIVLNGEDTGDHVFLLAESKDLLFQKDDLLAMGFRAVPGTERADGFVPVSAFSPPVTFRLDEKTGTVELTADPTLLQLNLVDLTPKREHGDLLRHNAGFLNYAVTYRGDGALSQGALSIPTEIGGRIGDYLGVSGFSYAKTQSVERWTRGLTTITRDWPEKLRRLAIGDALASSGSFGTVQLLGGVSLSSNFELDPYFVRYPTLGVSGALATASDVELYVNDLLVKREHLAPGQFELTNVPFGTGAMDVTLVTKDAFGREQRIEIPAYVTPQILTPGLHEYAYAAGFPRRKLGIESFDYGGPTVLATHRVGLSRAFTAGGRAEANRDVVDGGGSATVQLGPFGVLDASLAASHASGALGFAGAATYGYVSGRYNVGASLRAYSDEYATLLHGPSGDRPRLETSIRFGLRSKTIGAFSVSQLVSLRYDGPATRSTSAFYTRKLTHELGLNVSATRIDTSGADPVYQIEAFLLLLLGRSTSAEVRAASGDETQVSTALRHSVPAGPGFGYRFETEGRDPGSGADRTLGGEAAVDYHSPFANATAEYRRSGATQLYSLGLAGAIALVDNTVYPTRPVTDGFALVKVPGMEGVDVQLNGNDMGVTDRFGELLVPALAAEVDNTLSIEDRDIPVEYSIGAVRKRVRVPARGAGVVSFEVKKLQAFTGRLAVVKGPARIVPELWGLSVELPGGATEMLVGKGGEFYLENVPAGTYPARVFTKGQECKLELKIPESSDPMVDMGEVVCEIH